MRIDQPPDRRRVRPGFPDGLTGNPEAGPSGRRGFRAHSRAMTMTEPPLFAAPPPPPPPPPPASPAADAPHQGRKRRVGTAAAGVAVAALAIGSGWVGGRLSVEDSADGTNPVADASPVSLVASGGIDVAGVLAHVHSSVVSIESTVRTQRGPFVSEGKAAGTGIVIDAHGLILTNAHVVEGAMDIVVTSADG